MIAGIFILTFLVSSPALTATFKERDNLCSPSEFSCGDGGCVSLGNLCDGIQNCADGSDEQACLGVSFNVPSRKTIVTRSKRQTQRPCRRNQWRCRDGTCISFDGKCDGMVDCPDGSDETHPLCRNSTCQSNWFRCTYGACVDGTAPCNGAQECADNSDELLPQCRNETDEIRGQFRCADGQMISAAEHCDGVADCTDGSDETVRACAAKTCPTYLFQCAYGACVDQGADCNNVQECADGSDESDELCNRIGTATSTPTKRPSTSGKCVLPPYPEHGRYEVGGAPTASPGQSFVSLQINITCNPGYGVPGESSLYCIDGVWSMQRFPTCVRFCQIFPHPSVEYRCETRDDNSIQVGLRPCNTQEPSGTVVRPECKAPNYYYPGVLNKMRCIDGNWDFVAICRPGLPKNGTNITILIKDKVEFYISNFTYSVPLFKPVNDVGFDISEEDWRMGKPSVVNININNSSVVIKADKVGVNSGGF